MVYIDDAYQYIRIYFIYIYIYIHVAHDDDGGVWENATAAPANAAAERCVIFENLQVDRNRGETARRRRKKQST